MAPGSDAEKARDPDLIRRVDDESGDGPLPIEIAFLEGFGIARRHLSRAARMATVQGTTADRVLLAEGLLSAPQFYELLAEHLGVAYLHGPLPVAEDVPIDRALAAEMVRLAPNEAGFALALAPRGQSLASLLQQAAASGGLDHARIVITTPQRMSALIRRRHTKAIVREATHGLPDWNPGLSARSGPSRGQWIVTFAVGVAMVVGFTLAPRATSETICLLLSGLFLAMVSVRLIATMASAPTPSPRLPRTPDHLLPLYTIVVPLYREGRVVPRLVTALSQLDYPATALDIKIVLEADDTDTLDALHRQRLSDRFDILLAPGGRPTTKPRALNVGLQFARGRYVVVYDAEDDPEPGQLREAVHRFEGAGSTLGCLQARLAIDNGDDSWLSRQFALEYAALFDVINAGLARLRLPIALGGTSNHFRIEALRHVNGWDAWNVTEDIDLGIRLARFGYAVGVLESRTFEEAPYALRAWLGQRQRWQKGWLVTFKTHSRDPARVFAEVGIGGGLALFAILGGTIATSLLGPFFMVALAADAAFGPLLRPQTAGEGAWSGLVAVLVTSGLASLLAPPILANRRLRQRLPASWFIYLPAYLALMSVAGWRALIESLGRPHAWTKTEHGLAKKRTRPS